MGSALSRVARALGDQVHASTGIPWSDTDAARDRLAQEARHFLGKVSRTNQPWGIAWVAGHATTSASEREVQQELSVFNHFIGQLATESTRLSPVSRGSFLFASSAGGVYSGSTNAPFSSLTEPVPAGLYGQMKLSQEVAVSTRLSSLFNVTIVRIANIYGPGQNLEKVQGLISRLALSAITREPITIFVPMDTLRDFIFVDDAAAITYHWLTDSSSSSQVKVVATGNPISLGQIVDMVQGVARRRIPIAAGTHPSAAFQASDLRLIPDRDEWTSHAPMMPLPAGIRRTYEDILERHQQASSLTRGIR